MNNIDYINTAETIEHAQLVDFFVDWPNHPSPRRHLDILKASHGIELALDTSTNMKD